MFSQTVEYILRVVVYLANQHDNPSTTQEISSAMQVPVGYLAKIMQRLVHSGLVKSQRGRNGGFVLAQTAFRMSLHDVIQALEPIPHIGRCPLNLSAHRHELCPLHRRLDAAVGAVERVLKDASISDLLVMFRQAQTSRTAVRAR